MEKVVRRPADISPIEAREGLALAFPTAKVASFGTEDDGSVYVAKLVFSEFPPGAGDGPPEDDEGAGGPPPEMGGPDDEEDPAADDGDEDGPPKPKKDKKDKGGDKIEHQILDALKQLGEGLGVPIMTGEHDPGLDSAPPGGAPDDPMGGAAPPPPVAEDAPLPPPAAPKGAPGGGGGLGMPFSSVDKFAGDQHVASLRQSVAKRRSFSMAYEDGRTSTRVVADTARAMFPDFELKRIEQRTGRIDGGEPQPMYVFGMVRR